MNSDINLALGKTFDVEKKLRRVKAIKIIAIISLISVAMVSAILFLITFLLPISSVKKDQQQTLNNLSLLHKKLASYSLTNERVKNIVEILTLRKDYSIISDAVLKKVPSELAVDALTIEAGVITVNVSGVSLTPIDQFLDDMVSLANDKKIIKSLVIQSLTLSSVEGKYILSMQATIL